MEQQQILRVLIVEDNGAHRAVLCELIEQEGFNPVPCTSAAEAIRVVENDVFAVAIVDHRLPDMTGTELLKKMAIRQRGIRAIIHTGYRSFESAKEALNQGVFAYVEKLGHPAELLRHVHQAAQDWMAEALQQSQDQYRHLVESVEAIVWRGDPQTLHIHFVSQEAELLLGYPVERWRTEPGFWQTHIHPADRNWVIMTRRKAVVEQQSQALEYRMKAADGRVVWLRDIVKVLVENDQSTALIGVMVDITERKRLEKEILEISGREQRRIGQDLHDELGQLLVGTGFRVARLERELQHKNMPEAEEATAIGQMIEQAIDETRALAHGLDPIGMEAGGLMTGLRILTHSVEQVYGVSCTLTYPIPVYVDDLERATHVYRIAQEAINNAMKHGQATRIALTLRQEHDFAILTIQDNGIGIPDLNDHRLGMGLRIMKYRAGMIHGTFEVGRVDEGGTIVTCRFVPNLSALSAQKTRLAV